jgi:hypothetical protein
MPIHDKVVYLHSFGEYLMERKTNAYRVVLYSCGSFFAEVWHHNDFNEVDYVRAFQSTEVLEPYMQEISIGSAFQSSIN